MDELLRTKAVALPAPVGRNRTRVGNGVEVCRLGIKSASRTGKVALPHPLNTQHSHSVVSPNPKTNSHSTLS